MKPYLLDRVVSAGGEEVKKFLPTSGGTLMTATEAANLTELMRDVVVEGTGSSVRTDAIQWLQKRELRSLKQEKRHMHGLPVLLRLSHQRSLLRSW